MVSFAVKLNTNIYPRIAKVQLSSELVITCMSSSDPVWFFNREQIPEEKLGWSVKPNGSRLIITKIQASHAGEYNCFGYDYGDNPFIAASLLVVAGKA